MRTSVRPKHSPPVLVIGFLLLSSNLGPMAQTVIGVEEAEKPRLMILMEEKVMGVFGTTGFEQPGYVEALLSDRLREAGFVVVDPLTYRRNITRSQGLKMLEGDDKAAAAIGLKHGAQYLVLGTAISKPAGAKLYNTQLQSIHATLIARVVRSSDAQVIGTASASARKAHIDEVQGGVSALEIAAEKLAPNLSRELLRDLKGGELGVTQQTVLVIAGLPDFSSVEVIMAFFEDEVAEINAVALQSFTSGVAELRLDYAGRTGDLARHVAKHAFQDFFLEPTSVGPGSLDLRYVPRSAAPADDAPVPHSEQYPREPEATSGLSGQSKQPPLAQTPGDNE